MRVIAGILFVLCPFLPLPALASEVCPIKSIAVTHTKCERGLASIGPLNKFRYGGFCIYPLVNCIEKIQDTTKADCGSGVYVGARSAERIGGQCLFPASGWRVEKRDASSVAECQPSEIFFGPARAENLGGHCVKIVK